MIPPLDETAGHAPAFQYWLAAGLFVATFAAIVSEKLHKTKAALIGAGATLALGLLTQEEALHSVEYGVDYNVVFLLIAMMVIVNIIGRTGLFEWVAVRAAKAARGEPFGILAIFIVLTAVASALLDNVTTVLLMVPVTLLIAQELDIDPVPFLLGEALASNIGGTATLIGDPPNIIIASRAQLTFTDFLIHLAPAVAVMLVGFLIAMKLLFGKRLKVREDRRRRVLEMDERRAIRDPVLAKKSMVVLVLTLIGFSLHGALHLEPATIALCGAALLLAISKLEPHEVFAEVEWPTIFFFIGLFILVGGIVKAGIVSDLATLLIAYTHPTAEHMQTTTFAVLWGSAFLSSVVDNIPYVTTMAPLVLEMASSVFHGGEVAAEVLPMDSIQHDALMPVWWALALGSCLGGNGTAIGASANVVVVGIAERSGVGITFVRFMVYGVPTTLLTVGFSHLYLALRYF